MKPKLLIIEDELLIAAMTEEIAESYGFEVAAIAQSLEEATEHIQNSPFDLAIVDINLGEGLEGLQAGQMLKKIGKPFLYVTSYESGEIIKQASETGPGTYLIKPFNPAQLLAALEVTLMQGKQNRRSVVCLQDGAATHQLVLNDIRYVQADNIHIDIFTTSQRITLRMSLKSFKEQVPEELFLQPHRSYLVNQKYITRVTTSEIWLENETVPIARGYKDLVLNSLANNKTSKK